MLIESNVRSLFSVVFGGPYEELRVRHRIWTAWRTAPTSPSAAPLEAVARIDGTVEAIDEVHGLAPFTAEPSVYWHVRLVARQVVQGGMNLGINTTSPEVWYPALELSSTTSFWIVTDDGSRVLVDLAEAGDVAAVVPLEDVSDHESVNDEDELLNVFLRHHDIVPIEEMGRSGQYRFLEARITPGQRVAICGRVAELPTRIAAGYRDAATSLRRLTGTKHDPLIVIALAAPS